MKRGWWVSTVLIAAAIGWVGPATAQTETEPPDFNDTFDNRTVLSPGTVIVEAELFSEFTGVDTVMRAFVDGVEFDRNDDPDDIIFGDGLGSALLGVPIIDGFIDLEVSGFGDGQDGDGNFVEEFTGNHGESGFYTLIVDVFDDQGQFIDGFAETGFLQSGSVDVFGVPASIDALSYDAFIDNTVGDVDFFEFTGLTANTAYDVEITSDAFLDTILAEIDNVGQIVQTDDDGGEDNLSKLEITSDGNGELRIAVSGFPDFDLFNEHNQVGNYAVSLTESVLLGDYNGDGFVSQADLNLVLLNWGASVVPPEWINLDQFDGEQVSQNELNAVLLNWGQGTPPVPGVAAVPEPTGAAWLLAGAALLRPRRGA
ncbi:MAG: hypothetical protein AAF333_17430 [Planctomycetota bacterium]